MVTIKASYTVKPEEENENIVMSLSEFDQVAAVTHANPIYFIRTEKEFDFNSACSTLKDSLSKALSTYYPLAGRLHKIGDRFELHCNSMGAQLLIAESEDTMEDFGDFRPSTPNLLSVVPSVNYSKPISELPLVLIQITKLAENSVCLSFAISHIMADAISGLGFISELARIVRGDERNSKYVPPFFDRTILQAKEPLEPPSFEHPEYCTPPLVVGQKDAEQERGEETVLLVLKLNSEQIGKLVAKANHDQTLDENGNITTDRRPYSRFESVSGHVWRCVTKARKHEAHDQLTRLYFPVDIRRKVVPNLPPGYFGNAVCRVAAESVARELVLNPLSFASSKIREVISAVSDEYVQSSLRFLKCHKNLAEHRTSHAPGSIRGVFHGNPNLSINSWAKAPIGAGDFGWGKIVYMGPGRPDRRGSDGKCLMIPSLNEEGAFIIFFRLQERHMEEFEKLFYEEI